MQSLIFCIGYNYCSISASVIVLLDDLGKHEDLTKVYINLELSPAL